MERRIVSTLLGCALVACLLSVVAPPVSATVVFDDHFTGNSGGMPSGWQTLFGTGSVVESGTVVDLLSSKVVIGSDAAVDPSVGTASLVLEIAGVTGDAPAGAGFFTGACHIVFLIRLVDGRVHMISEDAEGGQQDYTVGYLTGYSGGPMSVTLVIGPTAFRISTDSPSFDSGSIAYETAFTTFTRADLGAAVRLCLLNDTEPGDTGDASFDRITVDIVPQVPVEGGTFGRIKALYRR